jgi:two-component system KDP operon response regulator KdpE
MDDEPAIRRLLRLALSAEGFEVVVAENGEEALALFAQHAPDLVLLDIVMPGAASGLDVLREIKASRDMPVILISARADEQARLEALALGADDFIAKPFSPERVAQSIHFLLGRGNHEAGQGYIVRSSDLEIDLVHRVVRRSGLLIDLNRSEWLLLAQLASHPGEPRLYQELLTSVWGGAYRNDLGYLRAWIKRLRHRVGDRDDSPTVILPYLDVGYLLRAD